MKNKKRSNLDGDAALTEVGLADENVDKERVALAVLLEGSLEDLLRLIRVRRFDRRALSAECRRHRVIRSSLQAFHLLNE